MPRKPHRSKATGRKVRTTKPNRQRPKASHTGDDRRDSRSQTQLSARLTRLFQGKIISAISRTQICRWLKGDLPVGVPLPPQPVNNVYDTAAWKTWIKTHILPLPGWGFAGAINGTQTELTLAQSSINARAQRDIDSAASVAIDLAVKQGKFKSVELFNKHITGFFAEINAYVAEGERVMESKLIEALAAVTVDDASRSALLAAIRSGVRQSGDNFRSGLRSSLEHHTETEEAEPK